MISMTSQQTPHAARLRMPVGTLARTSVICGDGDVRVKGTSVPSGIASTPATTAAVRPYAFDIPGIRCWSPPV
jgi:hypothetical protein